MKKFISLLLSATMLISTASNLVFAEEPESEKVRISANMDETIDVVQASTATAMPELDTGIFSSSRYYLSVERDYSQYRTIEIENTTYSDKEVYLVCGETPSDLAIDFIKGGSKSEPILLKAGETKEVELAIFAQNATKEDNEFDIYAYEIGKDSETPTSRAEVSLSINIPTFDVSTSLVSEDSNALAKTYKVTNNDDNTIADLSVAVDDKLSSYAYFDTYVENYSLEPGQSVEFTVKPDLKKMKEEKLSKLEGNLIVSGSGQTENISVSFDTNGQDIQYMTLGEVEDSQRETKYNNIHIDFDKSTIKYFDGTNWKEITDATDIQSTILEDGEFSWKFENILPYGKMEDKQITNEINVSAKIYTGDVDTYNPKESINVVNGKAIATTTVLYSGIELNNIIGLVNQTSQISLMAAKATPEPLYTENEVIELTIETAFDGLEDAYDPSDLAKESAPYYDIYKWSKRTIDWSKKAYNSTKVYSDPTLDPRFKASYLCFDTAYIILETLDVVVPFPYSLFCNVILQPWKKTLQLYQEQIENMANRKYNDGYKYGFYYNGHQCTNRGLISSDFYVPNYIDKVTPTPSTPTPSPTPEPYPQLEKPKVDIPSSTVEPGTKVTITPPQKGKVYYSLDNGEAMKYTEPITINDSTVLQTWTVDDSNTPSYSDSDVEEYTYTIDGQLFAPVPSPASGVVDKNDTVELTANEGEKIYYAVDTNLEDEVVPSDDEYIEYTEPISITKDCKIYTYTKKNGAKQSRTAELAYEVAITDPGDIPVPASLMSMSETKATETDNSVKLYYTGRMFGGGYINSQTTNYKYLLNGKEVSSGTNTGLTEVNIAEIPTDGLKLGKVNNFVRDYDTNPGSHSVSTDNEFTLIYPVDSVICYVGDSSTLPDVRLRPDFAIYNENVYCDSTLIVGQKNKIRVNYYNRGSQSGFYTINLYVNDKLVNTKENQFIKYFSAGSMELDFTPTDYNNNVKVEIINTTVDLEEEKSDNNVAVHTFTARDPEVPSIDAITPNSDTEQAEEQSISATISKNADVESVSFTVDGKDITNEVKSSGTSYWTTTEKLSVGAHKAEVKVKDIFGHEYTKEQDFNIIEPIERYEKYHFYHKEYHVYVKPNTEFDINDFVGIADDNYEDIKTLNDYVDAITVEFDPESGLTQKADNKFVFTAGKTGETDITLKLGVNETSVTIYATDVELQSCTYNIKSGDMAYSNIDVYHKDENGWSEFWAYDESYGKEGKSVQITIYPEDFTAAEDYKVFIENPNGFYIEDFKNGSVDITDDTNSTLSVKADKNITDVFCSVYYNFNEETSIQAGNLSTDKDGKIKPLSLAKGKYTIKASFTYGDDDYYGIEKEVDLTTVNTAEIDMLSLLNYAVVDLSAIKPSEDVRIYAVDEYGLEYINQVKISDTSYNVVLSDDMVENTADYKLFVVDNGKFYFAPLAKDIMAVTVPENNALTFTKADNIVINSVKINSIDELTYSIPIEYVPDKTIELPKNKYNIGVQFSVDSTNVYQEYDIDLTSNNEVIDLNAAAAKTNLVVTWSELYDDKGYMNLYSNTGRSSATYKNNTGTTVAAGSYDWTLNLNRGNFRYSVSNSADIEADKQTVIKVGTNFTGKLNKSSDDDKYETGKQIVFTVDELKDENGNTLNSCNGSRAMNAKIIYTNVYDENDVQDVALDITSLYSNSSIYATLPEKAGKYTAKLLIEGEKIAAPVASVESGTYKNSVTVSLTSETQNASIYYTTDGSEPTTDSTKYTGSVWLTKSCVLKAIAVVDKDLSSVSEYEYTINRTSSGGGSSIPRYTITISYVDENNAVVGTSKISKNRGTSISEENLSVPKGYKLDDEFSMKVTGNETVEVKVKSIASDNKTDTDKPGSSNDSDEKKFISGYEDGSFKPDNNVTRAEVAAIIYNMMNDGTYVSNSMLTKFTDISSAHWAASAIAFNIDNSYMNGDGGSSTFRPDDKMTRAELAQMLYNLNVKKSETNNISFTDINGHWGKNAIEAMAKSAVINGYEDGTFKPNNNVTRAETVTMISRLFDRSNQWTGNTSFDDVPQSHWAYSTIMNAANGSSE